jgi:hypothetical protein
MIEIRDVPESEVGRMVDLATYLGGTTPATLARVGAITEHSRDAAARLTAAPAVPLPPTSTTTSEPCSRLARGPLLPEFPSSRRRAE